MKETDVEPKSNVLNEAEFQAQLVARIRSALPLLSANIKVERHLQLHLGHHNIDLDGLSSERQLVQGRYDVLVHVDERPLLVAELKAPEMALTVSDRQQGLSYARLHEPMVPLVLITNGVYVLLLHTYDGREINPDDVEANRLKHVLKAASTIAASAAQEAIEILLGDSRETWRQLARKWTGEALTLMTGMIRDFRVPVVSNFELPRNCVLELERLVGSGTAITVLHGAPLSGVTNVLAQFTRRKSLSPVLFVDTRLEPDVLLSISNRLSRELLYGVTVDNVRQWINGRQGLFNLVLVLDGIPVQGFDELVSFAAAGVLQLLIGTRSDIYQERAHVAGRTQETLLGKLARGVELLPLSDDELRTAFGVISDSFQAEFFNGAQYTPEFRWPRSLRALMATLPRRQPQLSSTSDERTTRLMMPAVTNPHTLGAIVSSLAPGPELAHDLEVLAETFLLDADQNSGRPDWIAGTWGLPSVDVNLLEDRLGDSRVTRLREQGFVSWVSAPLLGPRVLIRVEELLVWFIGEVWANELAKAFRSHMLSDALDRLLTISSILPRGEISFAVAIAKAREVHDEVLGEIIGNLMGRPPVVERIGEGARLDVLLKGGRIRLLFGEGMDEEIVGNVQPWLVLSHLAAYSMMADGYDATVNLSIFRRLGVSPHLIYQPVPTAFEDITGFHTHEIEGIGTILCMSMGIVEPMLQALVDHAHRFPDELVLLANLAAEDKELHLGWRLLSAARLVQDATDEVASNAAREAIRILNGLWGFEMSRAMNHDEMGEMPSE